MDRFFITGANRGLGLGLARAFLARGHAVRGSVRVPASASELRTSGAEVEILDVTDPDACEAMGRALATVPLDVVVNNAGQQMHDQRLEDVDAETMTSAFRLHAVAPLLVTRALLPSLELGRRRLVVNISSDLGSVALNRSPAEEGWYSYRASKCALNMMTVNLARELGPRGFTCVAVHPGWVRTDMGGPRAPLSVEESCADLVALLEGLGPEHNGQYLRHDGSPMPW